ncbi:MAG: hypothetical protein IJ240_04945 [Clostridia bacterium]|nr:hypothetical protein [Clostridia bacterium]
MTIDTAHTPLLRLYHPEVPAFLEQGAETAIVQRLAQVGMNCGCEYTSFPIFQAADPYSRLDHSLGVGLIVWRFTQNAAQAISGLLHDVATPAFAHVIDFLRGDYVRQEATEDGTEQMIAGSPEWQSLLAALGLTVADVADYHRYPIADNDSPRLSADRLEYTLGNLLHYRLRNIRIIGEYYRDLTVCTAEDGNPELCFRTPELARDFALDALSTSRIYISDADRYAMQRLAELVRDALRRGALREADLYRTEPEVIALLTADPAVRAQWDAFRAMKQTVNASAPGAEEGWRVIPAKKRYIDPLILDGRRASSAFPEVHATIQDFLSLSLDGYVRGY